MQHAVRTHLKKSGEDHSWALITNEDAHAICKLLELGYGEKEIALQVFGDENAHISTISDIKYKHSWKNIVSQYNIPDINTNGARFNDNDLALMYNLINEGLSNRDILINLGFDPYSMSEYDRERVYKIIRRMRSGEGYHHIINKL